MSKEQQQGISPDQLFQQFTKSSSVVSNSFQLLFEGVVSLEKQMIAMSQENKMLKEAMKKAGIEVATVADTTPAQAPPNRRQRRDAEKQAKKK